MMPTIIYTNNIDQSLENIVKTTDVIVVKREEGKFISVDQIRDLKAKLYNSAVYGLRTVIIVDANLMNIQASNACLKLLEDTPKDTKIFLLSKYPLIKTIVSRCKIKYDSYTQTQDDDLIGVFRKKIIKCKNLRKLDMISDIVFYTNVLDLDKESSKILLKNIL